VTSWENGSLLYVVTNHVKAVAFGSQKYYQWPETSRATTGPGEENILAGPIWGENFRFFCFAFENGTFWCILYFWATVGSQNVAGPG